ncbi:MAG: response regulator [Thermodesulfobacteriota bacterium]
MRVLLVDDEKELVTTLVERLELRDIEADWAISAEQALEKAPNQFDIAVLDVKMPGISGLELKKRIENIVPDMRFIFMTGHGSQEDFERGSAEGEFYLVKPVSIELLVKKINEASAAAGK